MNNQTDKRTGSQQTTAPAPKHTEDEEENKDFPPKLSRMRRTLVGIFGLLIFCGVIVSLDQLFLPSPLLFPSCPCAAYIGLGIALSSFLTVLALLHRFRVHNARLEDVSVVEGIFVDADTIEPRLSNPTRPSQYDNKKKEIQKEVTRLKNLGVRGWTEYQVLSLDQMLVDFLKPDDLKARAVSRLNRLKEYAQDSTHPYDADFYRDWDKRINNAIEKMDTSESVSKRDELGDSLRAELRELLDHVADYQSLWKEGSVILSALRFGGVAAAVMVLVMGLVPLLHPATREEPTFGILNWALFGMSGSLIVVLRDLRNSKMMEAGDNEGWFELVRAVLGATLGFVAGVVTYAMIGGGLITGPLMPDIERNVLVDLLLSVVVGIGAGFAFEQVFDRLKSATEHGRQQ